MGSRIKALPLILGILMAVSIGLADQKAKGKREPSDGKGKQASVHVDVGIFVDNDRSVIRHHYLGSRGTLPPGLAKRRGDLPPGLEKQLRRNGHLPPGLEKKMYPFPLELERRLPPLRPGLVRGIIGASAVIIDKKTSLIVDVFALL